MEFIKDYEMLSDRLDVMTVCDRLICSAEGLLSALCTAAEKHAADVMPLDSETPATLGYLLLSLCQGFLSDIGRLEDVKRRAAVSPVCGGPLGCAEPSDRKEVALANGLFSVSRNCLAGLYDDDHIAELYCAGKLMAKHVCACAEKLGEWSEKGYISYTECNIDIKFNGAEQILRYRPLENAIKMLRTSMDSIEADTGKMRLDAEKCLAGEEDIYRFLQGFNCVGGTAAERIAEEIGRIRTMLINE